ncbi:Uma2 family endonuclease [Tautonia plasticadhaerens]|nr:Uma2 family endonuclease [Tautonia plasticadhaerens]
MAPIPSPPAPEPPAGRVRFTVSDYYRMAEAGILDEDSRVELIDGDLIAMCPIGPRHSAEVNRLTALLSARLAGRAIVSVQNPIRLDDHSEPEPDLMLVRPREDYYASAHPGPADALLLIEVMDSSAAYDRGTKLGLYARFGVAEVWLIDLDEYRVEVHLAPVDGIYTQRLIRGRGQAVAPAAFPDVELDVDAILG